MTLQSEIELEKSAGDQNPTVGFTDSDKRPKSNIQSLINGELSYSNKG